MELYLWFWSKHVFLIQFYCIIYGYYQWIFYTSQLKPAVRIWAGVFCMNKKYVIDIIFYLVMVQCKI